jgi:hypothetical protein
MAALGVHGARFGPRLCRRLGAATDFVQARLKCQTRHAVRTPLRLVLFCTQPRSVGPVESTAPKPLQIVPQFFAGDLAVAIRVGGVERGWGRRFIGRNHAITVAVEALE